MYILKSKMRQRREGDDGTCVLALDLRSWLVLVYTKTPIVRELPRLIVMILVFWAMTGAKGEISQVDV